MSYLENPICKFTPLFDIDHSIKKNIVSCSFFKMSTTGYKDFSSYIEGIKILHDFRIKDTGFVLRIFIDESIYSDDKIMNEIKILPNVELVLYSCPNFLIKDKKNHEGLFGTMVRFFPMFDFPNNDAKIVMISDVDICNKTKIYTFKLINIVKQVVEQSIYEKIKLLKFGNLAKNVTYEYSCINNGKPSVYAIAPCVFSFSRIPKNIIVDFLNEVKKHPLTKKYSYYYKFNEKIEETLRSEEISERSQQKHEKNKAKYDLDNNFIYGVDEYFLNHDLTNYLMDKNLPFANNFNFTVTAPIFYYMKFVELTHKQAILINRIINYILKKYDTKFFNQFDEIIKIRNLNKQGKINAINKKFKVIDEIIYGKDEYEKKKMCVIIYKLIIYLYSKPKYHFIYPKSLSEVILSNTFFGMYEFDVIMTHGENIEGKTYFINNNKKFSDETIVKLKSYHNKINKINLL